jgi:hypothetical protein
MDIKLYYMLGHQNNNTKKTKIILLLLSSLNLPEWSCRKVKRLLYIEKKTNIRLHCHRYIHKRLYEDVV